MVVASINDYAEWPKNGAKLLQNNGHLECNRENVEDLEKAENAVKRGLSRKDRR